MEEVIKPRVAMEILRVAVARENFWNWASAGRNRYFWREKAAELKADLKGEEPGTDIYNHIRDRIRQYKENIRNEEVVKARPYFRVDIPLDREELIEVGEGFGVDRSNLEETLKLRGKEEDTIGPLRAQTIGLVMGAAAAYAAQKGIASMGMTDTSQLNMAALSVGLGLTGYDAVCNKSGYSKKLGMLTGTAIGVILAYLF